MKVYELLSTPSRWCRGWFAVTEEGRWTSSTGPRAARWCAVGAITRCYRPPKAREQALARLKQQLPPGTRTIPEWNDAPTTTHATVLAAARKAGI